MIKLNEGQEAAKKAILNVVNRVKGDDDRFITFHGAAGCGKTFTFVEIVKSLPEGLKVGLTGPTHKCVKVMRNMAYSAGIDGRVDVRTIHSALGLAMKQVDGTEVLYRDEWAEEQEYDVLFIDESSMLDDIILGFILESKSRTVIFIGDNKQIGPVNSERGAVSSVFTQVTKQVSLTEVVRCGSDNPIIELATKLRLVQDDTHAQWPSIETNLLEDGSGVEVLPKMDWFNSVVDIFKSKEFKSNPDFCRCIAYTNDMVDKINAKVRRTIHGSDVAEYLVGDIVVAQSQGKLHKNSEECRVLSVDDHEDEVHGIPCWNISLSSLDNHSIYRVLILKECSISEVDHKLVRLANLANDIDKQNKRTHWKAFWSLKKTFDSFKHIYATTAHKCQGSTVNYTYVWSPDFFRFGATIEVKRLVYTATTRSSHRTVFAF